MRTLILGLLAAGVQCFAGTDAVYTVPTPIELSQYSRFKLQNVDVKVEDSQIDIQYKLPREIVQESLHNAGIHLVGNTATFPSQFEVKGEASDDHGSCFINENGLNCLVTYAFNTNLESVQKYLHVNFPTEYEPRSKVARVFSNEPGGILTVPGKFKP